MISKSYYVNMAYEWNIRKWPLIQTGAFKKLKWHVKISPTKKHFETFCLHNFILNGARILIHSVLSYLTYIFSCYVRVVVLSLQVGYPQIFSSSRSLFSRVWFGTSHFLGWLRKVSTRGKLNVHKNLKNINVLNELITKYCARRKRTL